MVFFGHYVHFYMFFSMPEDAGIFPRINNPVVGSLAVPMFFLMSGAIFAHNYSDKIISSKIDFREFFLRRIARLYPLHFVTLVATAAFQILIFLEVGRFFIYKFNDVYHFALNLFFISDWGFEHGSSFNGPVWSVSHEIFLYICFYFICMSLRIFGLGSIFLLMGCLASATAQFLTSNLMAKSAFAFFLGASIYVTIALILSFDRKRQLFLWATLCCFLIISSKLFLRFGLPHGSVGPILLTCCIVADVLLRSAWNQNVKRCASFFGNITYSSYLLHFPIQLLFVLFSIEIVQLNFLDPRVLICYVIIVMLASTLSYYFFERNAKRSLLKLAGYGRKDA